MSKKKKPVMGRPKKTTEEIEIEKLYKRLSNDKHKEELLSRDIIAKNEILYNFVKYGASSTLQAIQDSENSNTKGFARVVLSLYNKAFTGDLKAVELILKMSGLNVDRVDHTSSDGSMSPTPAIHFDLSEKQRDKIYDAISGEFEE